MNAVVTCLFTSIPNPLCPGCGNYSANPAIVEHWLQSLRGCQAVLLHDELTPQDFHTMCSWVAAGTTFWLDEVEMSDENLFFQRWRHLWDWLVANSTTEYVWFTDGSDVRMLNEPWPHMKPDTLYVGSEEDVVSNKWIVDNHPTIRDLAKRARQQPLANAGIVGGDRATVLRFLDRLIWRLGQSDGDLTDMAAFNLTLYEDWDGHVETGYPIHTKFGAWVASDPVAYWAHK